MTLQERVKRCFEYFGISYDCEYNCNAQQVTIIVEEGDWKHDHLFLKNAMESFGFECVDEDITPSDSDCYDCTYVFELY